MMNKKTVIALAALAFTTVSGFAESLEDKVNKLEKELNSLKAQQNETAVSATFAETKAYQNKLSWSPELRLRNDVVNYRNKGIDGYTSSTPAQHAAENDYSKAFNPATNVRLRLNMEYKADEDTKFVGRIGVTRNTQTSERICTLHAAKGPSANTNTVFEVDKAYVDQTYRNILPVASTLTFGILPTSGGSSTNIAENKPRQSMFPSLMFDMNTYGVIGTFNLNDIVTDGALRVIFAKAYTLNKDNFYYQCNRMIVKSADIAGLFYEQKLPLSEDNLFMLGVNRLGSIKATPFVGSPALLDTDVPSNMGDVVNIGAHFEVKNIAKSNMTAFAGIAGSLPNPSGNVANYADVTTFGSKRIDYAKGAMKNQTGWATHIGGVYEIAAYKTKFGAEFNHGSRYWFSGTQGAEDPFNKLATRGNAYEAYVIQSLSKYIFVKAGFLRIDEKYSGSGWDFGTAYDKRANTNVGYAMLNASF